MARPADGVYAITDGSEGAGKDSCEPKQVGPMPNDFARTAIADAQWTSDKRRSLRRRSIADADEARLGRDEFVRRTRVAVRMDELRSVSVNVYFHCYHACIIKCFPPSSRASNVTHVVAFSCLGARFPRLCLMCIAHDCDC